jgi:hypothetical protein
MTTIKIVGASVLFQFFISSAPNLGFSKHDNPRAAAINRIEYLGVLVVS